MNASKEDSASGSGANPEAGRDADPPRDDGGDSGDERHGDVATAPGPELELVRDGARAGVLLHPLRQRILEACGEPVSAAEVGRRLGVPRQKINYHMGELADAGFLNDAGEFRRGNLMERRYVATARRYVLAPEVLGPVAGGGPSPGDRFSAARFLGLAARVQSEVGQVVAEAAESGKRVSTLSLDTELRFESADQRARFSEALQTAVLDVVARHASPWADAHGEACQGRPYRLVLGVHPIPPAVEADREPDAAEDSGGDDDRRNDG